MRVAVIITARPSWAKAETVCQALVDRGVDLHIIACASALLERYGRVVDVIRRTFPDVPITEIWSVYEGANLLTSVKETGSLASGLGDALCRLRPDSVVVIADRHEILGAAVAARYLHLPLVHLQGGERTGSIDDSVRDSVTQLADVHCVCTERAKLRVYGLTGDWDSVFNTGCPSIDLAQQAMREPPVTTEELGGAGAPIDLRQPFGVMLHHPVTNEADRSADQMRFVIQAAPATMQWIGMWPGQDAGADAMSKELRLVAKHIHTVRNLSPLRFLRMLTQAAVLVGNSSAGIRECSYLGVPVVNVGARQSGRERGSNVVDVGYNGSDYIRAIYGQIAHGPYPSSTLYGRGDAGERIAEVICRSHTDVMRAVAASGRSVARWDTN